MVEVLSGAERRRRRAPQEKITIIQQTMEPGIRTMLDGSNIGSSPQMRGTHKASHTAQACHRFIPADAGNAYTLTAPLAPKSKTIGFHPQGKQLRVNYTSSKI